MRQYSKKQSAIDKALREEYKRLTLPRSKLEFMSRAPIRAVYLCDLNSDAEDMGGKWYPVLAGFVVSNGKECYALDSKEMALTHAQRAKDKFSTRLKAYSAECLALQD
jgi:hypothetical protein